MTLTNRYATLFETYIQLRLQATDWKLGDIPVYLKSRNDTNAQGQPAVMLAVVEREQALDKLPFHNYVLLEETATGAKVTSYDEVHGASNPDIERGVLEFDASDMLEALIATCGFLTGEEN